MKGSVTEQIDKIIFAPDGQHVAFFSFDAGNVGLIDTNRGTEISSFSQHVFGVFDDRVFSWDGHRIILVEDRTLGKPFGHGALPYQCDEYGARPLLTDSSREHFSKTFAVTFGPDIHIVDRQSEAEVSRIEARFSGLRCRELSPDGSRIIIAESRTLSVVDVRSGRCLGTLPGSDLMKPLAVACGGDLVVHVGPVVAQNRWIFDEELARTRAEIEAVNLGLPTPRSIAVARELKSGGETFRLSGHDNDICAISFTYDGSMIATGSADQTVRLWDCRDGTEVACLSGHNGAVVSVAFARNGHHLLSAAQDGTVRLWDVSKRAAQACIEYPDERPMQAMFDPHEPSIITLWEGEQGTCVRIHRLEDGSAVLADSISLRAPPSKATGDWSPNVHVYRVDRPEKQGSFALRGVVNMAAFAGEEPILAVLSGSPGAMGPKRIEAGLPARPVAVVPPSALLASSAQGKLVASAVTERDDQTLRVYDARSGAEIHSFERSIDLCAKVWMSPGGRWILSETSMSEAFLRNLERGIDMPTSELRGSIQHISASPDEKYLVVICGNGHVFHHEDTSGWRTDLPCPENVSWQEFTSCAFASNTELIVAFSGDAYFVVDLGKGSWRPVEESVALALPPMEDFSPARSTRALSVRGRRVATGSTGIVSIFDMETGDEIGQVHGRGKVRALAFSTDGALLVAVFAYGDIVTIDACTAKELFRNTVGKSGIKSAAIAADKLWVTVGAGCRGILVQIWDTMSVGNPLTLCGVHGEVSQLVFAPDASNLLAADEENLYLWDTQTGELRAQMSRSGVSSVAFSRDSRRIYLEAESLLCWEPLVDCVREVDSRSTTNVGVLAAEHPWSLRATGAELEIVDVKSGKAVAWLPSKAYAWFHSVNPIRPQWAISVHSNLYLFSILV